MRTCFVFVGHSDCLFVSLWLQKYFRHPLLKGLLIKEDPINKILTGVKTLEVRNFYCRCVKPGESFYLLRPQKKGDARNIHNQKVVEVVGKVEFQGNHWIPHTCFHNFFEEHQVSQEDYDSMRGVWKKDKGGCVGWKIKLLERFENSKFLAHSSQEWCLKLCFTGFLLVVIAVISYHSYYSLCVLQIISSESNFIVHQIVNIGAITLLQNPVQETWFNFYWDQLCDTKDDVQSLASSTASTDKPGKTMPPKLSSAEVDAWAQTTAEHIEGASSSSKPAVLSSPAPCKSDDIRDKEGR